MDESEYRKKVQETLDRIEQAFEEVDPDVAECEQAFGALTLQFADKSRWIFSAQPSVRQLWVAIASKGTAYHFNYEPVRGQWVDDKGKDIELFAYLRNHLKDVPGLNLSEIGG